MRERLGFRHEDSDPELSGLVDEILAAAREVRTELGAGLFEEVYRLAMMKELTDRGVVKTRVPLLVTYKGVSLGKGYQADIIVDDRIILELKAVESLHPQFEAQLLTYMRLTRTKLGFLINFHAVPFGEGIKRRFSDRRVVVSSRSRV